MPAYIIFTLFILIQTSFAQRAKLERVPFIHPGIMMTGEQLDLMRDRINKGIEPQKSAFDVLKKDRRAAKDYKPNNKHFKWDSGERDAQACWVQALMWSITQEAVYAENVLNIMDAYSTLEEVTGTTKDLRIGLMGTMFMRGAEIVKHTYPKWRPETEKKFMEMYDRAFMPTLLTRVEHENNWMSSITESLMATAIFKDDPELFDLAVYRLKIYLPTNVPRENGQPAELWRDIAHAEEGIGALIQTAEMARNQGVDAYGWLDNRMVKGMEYLGEVIDTKDKRFKKNYPLDVGWEIVYNHYHYRMGMEIPWTKKLVRTVRPEGLFRHTSLGTLIKGEMDKDRPVTILHWRLPKAYTGAPYSHTLKRYGCSSPVEWVLDEETTLPAGLKISTDGQVTGNVQAAPGVYKIVLKSSGPSCDPITTTYYLPVSKQLPPAQVKATKPGLRYEYRTPHFDTEPGLKPFQSLTTGSIPTFRFPPAKDEAYALRFTGYLDVPTDGSYSFQVGTENQSRLYIDDRLVVDHWMRDNRARIAWSQFDSELGLKAGKHKIVLTVNNGNYKRGNLYGEWPSMRNLFKVQWKIPGAAKHVSIPQSALLQPSESSVLLQK
ncbi:MAG: alginate lyase family protein [Akkermansiaceae bacterium]